MSWLQGNWFKIALVVIVFAGFYWFAYRPAQIKERCFAEAEFNVANKGYITNRQDLIDTYYKNCLRRFGLN